MQNISVIDHFIPPATRTLPKSFFISIIAALVVAAFAQVSIPMIPVPMTLQPFAMIMVGLLFPWRLAVGTVIAYISMSAMGLPVLAGFNGGVAPLMGPTAGYIFGYIPTVFVISFLNTIGAQHLLITRFLSIFAGYAVLFTFGVTALSQFVGFDTALQTGLYPFILGDFVKAGIAALLAGVLRKKIAS